MKRRLISWLLVLTFVIAAIPAAALPVSAAISNKVDATIPFSRIERGEGALASTAYIKLAVEGWSNNCTLHYYLTNSDIITADKPIDFSAACAGSIDYNTDDVQSILFPSVEGLTGTKAVYMYWVVVSGSYTGGATRADVNVLKLGSNDDTAAPTVVKADTYAVRESNTSDRVTFTVTLNEPGRVYYSTSSISTSSLDSYPYFDIEKNGKNSDGNYSESCDLVVPVGTTKVNYLAVDVYGNKQNSTSYSPIDYFTITEQKPTNAYTTVFTYDTSVDGTLYYELSTKATAPSSFTNTKSLKKGTTGYNGTTSNNTFTLGVQGYTYLHYYYKYGNAVTAVHSIKLDAYAETIDPKMETVRLESRGEGAAKVSFQASQTVTLYYAVGNAQINSKTNITNTKALTAGTAAQVDFIGLARTSQIISYYIKDTDADYESDIMYFTIAAYVANDEIAPTISDVSIKYYESTEKNYVTVTFKSSEAGNVYFVYSNDASKKEVIAKNIVSKGSVLAVKEGVNTITVFEGKSDDFDGDGVVVSFVVKDYSGNVDDANVAHAFYIIKDVEEVELSNIYAVRGSTYIDIRFTANLDGYITFDKVDGRVNGDKYPFKPGFNEFHLRVIEDLPGSYEITYHYALDSKLTGAVNGKVFVPSSTDIDESGLIKFDESSITVDPAETVVSGEDGVVITIKATSTLIPNPTFEYSFDGGYNWTLANTKTVRESTIFTVGMIKARLYGDSTTATYPNELKILNVDNKAPVINAVKRNPETTTDPVSSVRLSIDATDNVGGIGTPSGGLQYNFGYGWTTSSSRDYTRDTVIPAGTIQVKDKVGNITVYNVAITINNIDEDRPNVTNFEVERTKLDEIVVTFEASENATFYYAFPEKNSTAAGSQFELSVSVVKGKNTLTINGIEKHGKGTIPMVFYVQDAAKLMSSLYSYTVPAFAAGDKVAPEIVSVTLSEDGPTNKPVMVIVEAKDDVALHDEAAYSFDGGKTWQKENEYEVTRNTTFSKNDIVVRDINDNMTKYNKELKIDTIDLELPTIAVSILALNKKIVISVIANDNLKLHNAAYSYNGGSDWEAASQKTLAVITDIPAGTIQVRDAAGNVRAYNFIITKAQLEAKLNSSTVTVGNFKDVATTDWAYTYIMRCAQVGIIQGEGDVYRPKVNMSRRDFVTILGRFDAILGMNTGKAAADYGTVSKFSDVPANQYYTPYINWASEMGIVNGRGNNIFDPNASITREEMCTMLIRFLNRYGITNSYKGSNLNFFDKALISSWAQQSIAVCNELGIVIGDDMNRFNPKSVSTREQVATVFARLCDMFGL